MNTIQIDEEMEKRIDRFVEARDNYFSLHAASAPLARRDAAERRLQTASYDLAHWVYLQARNPDSEAAE